MLNYLAGILKITIEIEIEGEVRISYWDTYTSMSEYKLTGDRHKIILKRNTISLEPVEENIDLREHFSESKGMDISSPMLFRYINLNNANVKITGTDLIFENKYILFKNLIFRVMEKNRCKSVNLVYIIKGTIYRGLVIKNMDIVTEYIDINQKGVRTVTVRRDDLESIFKINPLMKIACISPNKLIQSYEDYVKDLKKLKGNNLRIRESTRRAR